MASQGPNSPTDGANNVTTGVAWSGEDDIVSSDDSHAECLLSNSSVASDELVATGFSFSIPSGATIDGYLVEVERHTDTTAYNTRDLSVELRLAGAAVCEDRASGSGWPTTDAYASYGGSSDLWGFFKIVGEDLVPPTPSDLNDGGFGVILSAQKDAGKSSTYARVDHVRVTVYYTVTGGGAAVNLTAGKPGGLLLRGKL